ncbi:MAG TPA: hypothetical protein PK205_03740 [Promineifilum sp.]|nr:hypothetical protein [Promineifilum sp.]HRO89769.1 hypothetical protein [Promineifilum sp.]HRQ12396.1 hypothetical protein [Promineifilum sp.]
MTIKQVGGRADADLFYPPGNYTAYASGVADPDTALSEIDASWLTE